MEIRISDGNARGKADFVALRSPWMCKHILNVQAAIRAPCCRKWFDVSGSPPVLALLHASSISPLTLSSRKPDPDELPGFASFFRRIQCAECHAEASDHELARTMEMAFLCKKCKKAFRKDMEVFEESDEYCPHCDNHFIVDAKTPKAVLQVEGEDVRIDSRSVKLSFHHTDPYDARLLPATTQLTQ